MPSDENIAFADMLAEYKANEEFKKQVEESVKKIKSTKQPDFDLFIESLTESEAKFLIEKLQKKLL